MRKRGELAIVLHTHMPYVEGSGPGGYELIWLYLIYPIPFQI
jgi:predicted glycosyl hydrolase (DUF1957 family)